MDLQAFAAEHGGLALVIRRHFESRKVEAVRSLVDKSTALTLRLGRHLDDAQQGLSAQGTAHAVVQGKLLAGMGLIPAAIVAGLDQRNLDGGLATSEGIGDHAVPVYRNPGISYPYYGNPTVGRDCLERWGDLAVHRHLSGLFRETRGLWTESVVAFQERIMGAVSGITTHGYREFGEGFEMWDLNFEQMVVLHQRLIVKRPFSTIDLDHPYEPDYGAGIAIAKDGTVAEFTADLQLGPSIEAKS